MEYIHHFFLTDSESHVSFSFTFRILILDTDVKTLLIEVRSSLIIVEIFELFGNIRILLQASINILISVVVFCTNEVAAEFLQTFLSLLELLLLDSTKFVIILLRDVRLNLTWSCVGCDIVKINIGLQVAFLHQFNRFTAGIYFILKFEIVIFLLEVRSTSCHVLLVLTESITQRLLSISINDSSLRFENELFTLLSFGFLLHLADL